MWTCRRWTFLRTFLMLLKISRQLLCKHEKFGQWCVPSAIQLLNLSPNLQTHCETTVAKVSCWTKISARLSISEASINHATPTWTSDWHMSRSQASSILSILWQKVSRSIIQEADNFFCSHSLDWSQGDIYAFVVVTVSEPFNTFFFLEIDEQRCFRWYRSALESWTEATGSTGLAALFQGTLTREQCVFAVHTNVQHCTRHHFAWRSSKPKLIHYQSLRPNSKPFVEVQWVMMSVNQHISRTSVSNAEHHMGLLQL